MNHVILIPVYKKTPDKSEIASLEQAAKVLYRHDFKIVHPESLDCSHYSEYLDRVNLEFIPLEDKHFSNLFSYSKLMMKLDFYKIFEKYDYMLVYQPDAWIFEDRLEYWGEKGFDYIGAPWFEGYDNADKNSKMLEYSGNGGFSFRNIKAFIKTLELYEKKFKNKKCKSWYKAYKDRGIFYAITHLRKSLKSYYSYENTFQYILDNYYEDCFISNYFREINPEFKIAKGFEAVEFSFEAQPERLFEMNNKKLPMGCHAFEKYDWEFWKKYIKF